MRTAVAHRIVAAAWLFLIAGGLCAFHAAYGQGGRGGKSSQQGRGPRSFGFRNNQFYHGPFPGKGGNYQTFYHFYKPTPNSRQFHHHTAFFFPRDSGKIRGGFFYYKNKDRNSPHFNKFWGRCQPGADNYELLAESKRKEKLEDIASDDFVKQGRMTPVPGMEPSTPLLSPPKLEELPDPTEPPEE